MFRAAIFAACVAAASAFAPTLPAGRATQRTSGVSGMKMQSIVTSKAGKSKAMPFLEKPVNLDGSMAGDVGFDPLGFSTFLDVKWLREAELKHGRICMLAWTGCIVQEVIHLPGKEFAHPFAFDAWAQAPRGGMLSILAAIGLIEMISNRFQLTATDMFADPSRKPGNLGFDPLSLSTPANRAKYELAEVTHGRAAMMGFSGIIHQMIVTKQGTIEQMMNFKSVDPAAFKGLAALKSIP